MPSQRPRILAPSFCLVSTCLLFVHLGVAQQLGDLDFTPSVGAPAYTDGNGPLVLIDEAHHNFHTASGRYQPFAELLRRDGYVVEGLTGSITLEALAEAEVLVISNALSEHNAEGWTLPTPSAFSDTEIDVIEAWVNQGGALLLIADHMPFPGAVEALGARFGVVMGNGFAFDADSSGMMKFEAMNGSLLEHPMTQGRNASEVVPFVTSFTGQAFRTVPSIDAEPLMMLGPGTTLIMPADAWAFSETTPHIGAEGMLQGVALQVGTGRVAVFGEAAMFTAQLAGPQRRPMGMNHPEAPHNAQFLLNVLHWLSGLLPAR